MSIFSVQIARPIQDAICILYLHTMHVHIGSLAQMQFLGSFKQVFVPFAAMTTNVQLLQEKPLCALNSRAILHTHFLC